MHVTWLLTVDAGSDIHIFKGGTQSPPRLILPFVSDAFSFTFVRPTDNTDYF